MIKTGLERIIQEAEFSAKVGKDSRIGYLSNQACTDRNLVHGRILLQQKFGARLTCLFSPQHGFFSEKQDNMIESDHSIDGKTGLPICSLYGEHRKPTGEMYENLDVLLIDLIDVGTRVYTFMYTMAYCLEAAKEYNKKVIILDRPNPIGGDLVEGNILQEDCTSFVGLYPIPMRHGMTMGELAKLFNDEFGLQADLEVIPVSDWQRDVLARDLDFPWIAPSPNMPTPEAALVYPGQVIWEGTNVSEGRGTTQPFEFCGAPYCNHDEVLEFISRNDLPGCLLRPVVFEPTSGKWAKQSCNGFQIHVTDSSRFKPYRTSLALYQAISLLYPDQFQYKEPPYEYEYERLPMDLILGDKKVRKALENGTEIADIEKGWQAELLDFEQVRQKYLLY